MKTRNLALAFLLALPAWAAVIAGPLDEYAYAWPLQTPGDSAAWQLELSTEMYAAIGTQDLRDIEVVNANGKAVPLAPYRVPPEISNRSTLVELPIFSLPRAATATGGAASAEAIHLQIERDADGKLRRLDATVGNVAQSGTATAGRRGGAKTPADDALLTSPRLITAANDNADVLLDASAVRDPMTALSIDWASIGANISAQFTVSGSDDLQQWKVLVPSATVLRLTQDGNVLNRHEIALNGAQPTYLLLHRIDDGAVLPSIIVRARTAPRSSLAQPARVWEPAAFDGVDNKHRDRALPTGDGLHTVAFRYHLPAALAVDSIRLELADDNSLARVAVLSREPGYAEADDSAWARRGDTVAFRLHQGGNVIGNDEFPALRTGRARDWRIEFTTPLESPPHLTLAYQPDRFVFLAQGSPPYRLVAGSASARRIDYPVDSALSQLRASLGVGWQPPLASAGARVVLQGDAAYVAAPAPAPVRDWKTWALWAMLVLAAVVISVLALSLLKNPDSR